VQHCVNTVYDISLLYLNRAATCENDTHKLQFTCVEESGSSVSIVTGYGLGEWDSIRDRGREFFLYTHEILVPLAKKERGYTFSRPVYQNWRSMGNFYLYLFLHVLPHSVHAVFYLRCDISSVHRSCGRSRELLFRLRCVPVYSSWLSSLDLRLICGVKFTPYFILFYYLLQ
jgi:hypothetical protein